MKNYLGGTSLVKTESKTSITHSIQIDYKTDFTAFSEDELAQMKKKYMQNASLKIVLHNFKQILEKEIDKIQNAIESEEIIYVEVKDEPL